MTIVCAINTPKYKILAADTGVTDGNLKYHESKIVPFKTPRGTYYIGVSGYGMTQNILMEWSENKKLLKTLKFRNLTDVRNFAFDLFSQLTQEKEVWPETKDDSNDHMLIITPKKVFSFQRYLYAREIETFFCAGSGMELGMGLLDFLYTTADLDDKEMVEQMARDTIATCIKHCTYCSGEPEVVVL